LNEPIVEEVYDEKEEIAEQKRNLISSTIEKRRKVSQHIDKNIPSYLGKSTI